MIDVLTESFRIVEKRIGSIEKKINGIIRAIEELIVEVLRMMATSSVSKEMEQRNRLIITQKEFSHVYSSKFFNRIFGMTLIVTVNTAVQLSMQKIEEEDWYYLKERAIAHATESLLLAIVLRRAPRESG